MVDIPDDTFARAREIQKSLFQQGVFQPTPLTAAEILKQRKLLSGLPGLEPADYATQGREATDLAKLQMALAIAQRGFAGMGEAPRPGESAISTFGRSVLAPIAQDVSPIATELMQQRRATKAAERADKARLSQAALTMQQGVSAREDAARAKQFTLAESLTRESFAPTKDLERKVKVDGKLEWRPFSGFVMTNSADGPRFIEIGKGGKREEVPSDEVRQWRKPVDPVKPVDAKLITQSIQIPVRNKSGEITGWKDGIINRVQQVIPIRGDPKVEWGPEVYWQGNHTRPWTIPTKTGERLATEGVDFVGTDKKHWKNSKDKKYFLKTGLSVSELNEARRTLGEINPGEGLERWIFTHKDNPELVKYQYDIKGRLVNLTPEQGNRWLTTTEPKEELKADWRPGKSFKVTREAAVTINEAHPNLGAKVGEDVEVLYDHNEPETRRFWLRNQELDKSIASKLRAGELPVATQIAAGLKAPPPANWTKGNNLTVNKAALKQLNKKYPDLKARVGDTVTTHFDRNNKDTPWEFRLKGTVIKGITEFLQAQALGPDQTWPKKGKRFGTKVHEITTEDATGNPVRYLVYPWETSPGQISFKKAPSGTDLTADEIAKLHLTMPDETTAKILRPSIVAQFKEVIGRQGQLDADIRETLNKQTLTGPEILDLSKLDRNAREKRLQNIVLGRVGKLRPDISAVPSREVVTDQAMVADPRVMADPRVKTLISPAGVQGAQAPSVVPRILFDPWSGRDLQLGHGSHFGFSRKIEKPEFQQANQNWEIVRRDFMDLYPGQLPGNDEEMVLLFSGLWKNLPSVAPSQKAPTLRPDAWRSQFAEAMSKYNAASKEWTDASALEIGTGTRKKNLQDEVQDTIDVMDDNVTMHKFRRQGGAWFLDGGWLAELRGGTLGELWEKWTTSEGKEVQWPTAKWLEIMKPDDQLDEKQKRLKYEAFEAMRGQSKYYGDKEGRQIGLSEFEQAAEYLGALHRYRARAFQLIDDSRPSDKDIEILLEAFVGSRDSKTVIFQKLAALQRFHATKLNRLVKNNLRRAAFSSETLINLNHLSRALNRSAIRDVDRSGKPLARPKAMADLFQQSARTISNAADAASRVIIPGYRRGALSPLSKSVDENTTADLYRKLEDAATAAFPGLASEEAIKKFLYEGLHLKQFRSSFTSGRTPPGAVREKDGSYTLLP